MDILNNIEGGSDENWQFFKKKSHFTVCLYIW